MNLKLFVALLLVLSLPFISAQEEASPDAENKALRGVQNSLRDIYKAQLRSTDNLFHCLDGSPAVAISAVNDNYCDCSDGSDEPGTAACSYHIKFPPEFRFQCFTKIHEHYKEIFHSRVNDGICDCCDGSDEYELDSQGGKLVACPNDCAEQAEKHEKESAEREERRQAGLKAKEEMIKEGEENIQKYMKELEDKKQELVDLQPEWDVAEEEKKRTEALEQAERDKIKEKSLGEKEVWNAEQEEKRKQKEEAREQAEGEDHRPGDAGTPISATASSSVMCVKWRQTNGCRADGERDVGADKECATEVLEGWSGYCECVDTVNGEEKKYDFDCGHGALVCEYVCKHDGETGTLLAKTDELKDDEEKVEEFQVDEGTSFTLPEGETARAKYNEVTNKKTNIDARINELKNLLGRGDAEEKGKGVVRSQPAFFALNGKCFEKNERTYTYSLCLYDRIDQRSNEGGGTTNMGNWQGFEEQSYSLWGAKADVSKMKFDNGQQCWGGPARSTEVHVICGPQNEVLSVDEPSMCTYKMVFQTPAICE